MISFIHRLRRSAIGRLRLILLTFSHRRTNISSRGFYCGKGCFLSRKNAISIGDNFYMGNNCHIAADCEIGNDVLFASFVSIVGGDHRIDDIDCIIRLSGRDTFRRVVIEDNVWIGHGSIIMQGVTIRSGAVVAAGSVVTKDVGQNSIVGGNPARLIRMRRI